MTKPVERYTYAPPVGKGIDMSPEQMEQYVARYSDLSEDLDIFPDIRNKPEGRRKHFHVISHNQHLGPSKITSRHSFHLSFLEVPPGSRAGLHAHRLPEIFIVHEGQFALIWGNHEEHRVLLGPRDTISVPPNVMRTFQNVGEIDGVLQVIYDGEGEVLGEIFVPEKKEGA